MVGSGQSPGRKRILAYFEGHRTLLLYLYDNLRGTIYISVPLLQIWEHLSARVPMIYAHEITEDVASVASMIAMALN